MLKILISMTTPCCNEQKKYFLLNEIKFFDSYSGLANAQRRDGIEIPKILRGSWFSWEGRPVTTVLDVNKMSDHGRIVKLERNGSDYTMIFQDRACYYCIKAFTRYIDDCQFL